MHNFRDLERPPAEAQLAAHIGKVQEQFVKIAGHEGLNATWLPSCGAGMRRATANGKG